VAQKIFRYHATPGRRKADRSGIRRPIQFYPAFISYSTKDQEFADRLYADHQKNIRCWPAIEDLKIGDRFRTRLSTRRSARTTSSWLSSPNIPRKAVDRKGRPFPNGLPQANRTSKLNLMFCAGTGATLPEQIKPTKTATLPDWFGELSASRLPGN